MHRAFAQMKPSSYYFVPVFFKMDQIAEAGRIGMLGRPPNVDTYWQVDAQHPWSLDVDRLQAQEWARCVAAYMEEYGQSFLKGADDTLDAFKELRRIAEDPMASLRRTKELVEFVVASTRADPRVPTEHANKLERKSEYVQERIEMLGFSQSEQESGSAEALAEFEL